MLLFHCPRFFLSVLVFLFIFLSKYLHLLTFLVFNFYLLFLSNTLFMHLSLLSFLLIFFLSFFSSNSLFLSLSLFLFLSGCSFQATLSSLFLLPSIILSDLFYLLLPLDYLTAYKCNLSSFYRHSLERHFFLPTLFFSFNHAMSQLKINAVVVSPLATHYSTIYPVNYTAKKVTDKEIMKKKKKRKEVAI